jgi:His-Xaa-Ser system protein HxsD
MTVLTFDANIYDKEVLLYVLNQYDIDYDIKFNENNFNIHFSMDLDENDIKLIKKKINDNQLRKDIANSNKKIREYIIATAL